MRLKSTAALPDGHPMNSDDPFRPGGRIFPDKMLPPRRASRVLCDAPALLDALGERFTGNWKGGRVDYESITDPSAERYADVQVAISVLLDRVNSLTALTKAISHGAIREGLRMSTTKGSRELNMTGGKVIAYLREQGTYHPHLLPVFAGVPLSFFVANGDGLCHHEDDMQTEVPADVAADPQGEGLTVEQPTGTYRCDLLAVAPVMTEQDDGVEWYLFLGGPTDVKRLDEAQRLEPPPVPAAHDGAILPLYRIISRQGTKGISTFDCVANRVNGV